MLHSVVFYGIAIIDSQKIVLFRILYTLLTILQIYQRFVRDQLGSQGKVLKDYSEYLKGYFIRSCTPISREIICITIISCLFRITYMFLYKHPITFQDLSTEILVGSLRLVVVFSSSSFCTDWGTHLSEVYDQVMLSPIASVK